MSGLTVGDIVFTNVAGAQHNPRPVVVVSEPDAAGSFYWVGISTSFDDPPPPQHVLLPWHSNAHPRTGLKRKCVAKTDWVGQGTTDAVVRIVGRVPPIVFTRILDALGNVPPKQP